MQVIINNIIADIKAKKELSSIEDSFLRFEIEKYIKKNKKVRLKVEAADESSAAIGEEKAFTKLKKTAEYKQLLKAVRSLARKTYGVFKLDAKKQNEFMDAFRKLDPAMIDFENAMIIQLHETALLSHQSTKERVKYYDAIYDGLFAIIGECKVILDLACGLNPFSYHMIPDYHNKKFIASELSKDDCKILQEYFDIVKNSGLNGRSIALNLTNPADIARLAEQKNLKADVCLLLKAVDTLEDIRRYVSKELLKAINSRWIIASFPRKSISGKKMKDQRYWFENLVKKMGFELSRFEVPNELFYIIEKDY